MSEEKDEYYFNIKNWVIASILLFIGFSSIYFGIILNLIEIVIIGGFITVISPVIIIKKLIMNNKPES